MIQVLTEYFWQNLILEPRIIYFSWAFDVIPD